MQTTITHVIIFSHDFGVRKNDRGLFTAIAREVADKETETIMFDYYPFNQESTTLTAKPLPDQALKLRKMINTARADFPDAEIDVVCHGEGCIAAALVKTRGIRKIIIIAPPDDVSQTTTVARLAKQLGVNIDVATRTKLQLSDASIVIHPEYWQGMDGMQPVKLYNRLNKFTKLRIINARQDDVYTQTDFAELEPSISAITLDGDHAFSSVADRGRLIYILQKELRLS